MCVKSGKRSLHVSMQQQGQVKDTVVWLSIVLSFHSTVNGLKGTCNEGTFFGKQPVNDLMAINTLKFVIL